MSYQNVRDTTSGDDFTHSWTVNDKTAGNGLGIDLDVKSGASLTDASDFDGTFDGIELNLGGNGGLSHANKGEAANDTITNIENVTGSRADDLIRGNGDANTLKGGKGDDYLAGRGGDDVLNGGRGDDYLVRRQHQQHLNRATTS